MALNLIRLLSMVASLAVIPVAAEELSEKHQACVDKLITAELAQVKTEDIRVITPTNANYKYDIASCWSHPCHTVDFFVADKNGLNYGGYAEVQFTKNSCRFYVQIPKAVASARGAKQTNKNLVLTDITGRKALQLTSGPHNDKEYPM